MQCLLHGRLSIKTQLSINLCRHLPRNNLQDLLSELHKQRIECGLDFVIKGSIDFLSFLNSGINELCIFGFLGGCEDEGGVGGGILRLVLCDGGKVTGVADDGLYGVSSVFRL
jgi:hypothetical protein